jgi:hypothetical protein
MKTLKKVLINIYNFLLKIVSHPSINFLFTILAIYISWITLHHADKQFELNSKSSDSLFNVQLRNSKELNESLINQIKELQNITKSQLDITDEQLGISKKTLNEQIYSGRPKIILVSVEIEDTNNIVAGVYSPKITLTLKNNGKRFALNCFTRHFTIDTNYKSVSSTPINLAENNKITIESDNSASEYYLPKNSLINKNDFFYVFETNYYDDALRRKFKQTYFDHYYKTRGVIRFYICSNDEKIKVLRRLNEMLKANNEPLLSDD